MGGWIFGWISTHENTSMHICVPDIYTNACFFLVNISITKLSLKMPLFYSLHPYVVLPALFFPLLYSSYRPLLLPPPSLPAVMPLMGTDCSPRVGAGVSCHPRPSRHTPSHTPLTTRLPSIRFASVVFVMLVQETQRSYRHGFEDKRIAGGFNEYLYSVLVCRVEVLVRQRVDSYCLHPFSLFYWDNGSFISIK